MFYQRLPPSPSLQGFVKEYMLFHLIYDSNVLPYTQPLPPLPEHGLEFLPMGLATAVNQQSGIAMKETPQVIFGQPVSRYNFVLPSSDYLVVRVIFQPGGLFRFLGGLPLSELADKIVETNSILGNEMQRVNERLLEAKSYAAMIEIVENYLHNRLRTTYIEAHAIDQVGQLLMANPTRFSLDWLANQAHLSPRQFNRKFTERIGIGPKLFSRICRFHKAFLWKEANPKADWLTVATRFGYTDFQHLFKEWKEFAGVTPKILLDEHAALPKSV